MLSIYENAVTKLTKLTKHMVSNIVLHCHIL